MDNFIQKVRLRQHQFPCWFTPELRHISKCMRTLKKQLSKHPTPPLQSKLTNLKSDYSNKILHAKSMYESQLVQSFAGPHNAKIFDCVRSLSRKSSIPATVFLNDSSATSNTEKAELFNNFSILSSLKAHTFYQTWTPYHYLHPAYVLYLSQTLRS